MEPIKICQEDPNRDVQDVRQFVRTVIWPTLPTITVSKLLWRLLINFREQRVDRFILRFFETDFTRQILKLTDKPCVLKLEHRRNRLHLTTEHKNLHQRHWRSVLFSDELWFCVDFNDGRNLFEYQMGISFWACQLWRSLDNDFGRH